jgi:hypothetical protein
MITDAVPPLLHCLEQYGDLGPAQEVLATLMGIGGGVTFDISPLGRRSRRLAILTTREINELYGLPCFTDEERCIYFDLSPAEHDAVDAVHTDAAAVHMVLQLGYFKAKRQVFIYEPETVCDDLRHIMKRYFPGMDNVSIKALSKPTRLEQQHTILALFGYRRCDGAAKEELEFKARRIAMLSTQPITGVFAYPREKVQFRGRHLGGH